MVELAKIDDLSVYELVAHLFGIDENDYPIKDGAIIEFEDAIDEALNKNFNIDFDDFQKIINHLLPLVDVAKSPLTNIWHKGFGTGKLWLAKIEVKTDVDA